MSMEMDMDIEREGLIEETRPWAERDPGDAVETTRVDGDVSVSMDVAIGGNTKMQGGALVKGNVKIQGWLIARNIKGCYKGLFTDSRFLKEKYPHPLNGWWAIVGKSVPGDVWVAYKDHWGDTGEIGVDPEDALNRKWANEYADKGDAETLEKAKRYTDEKEEALRGDMEDADRQLRDDMTEADRQLRDDMNVADKKLREDMNAADKKLREDFTDADTSIREEMNAADTRITEEFRAADTQIRNFFTAADNTITKNYKAADEKVLEDAESYADEKDNALRTEVNNRSDEKDKEVLAKAKEYAGSVIDTNLNPVPVGTVLMWAGNKSNIPENYKLCDGSILTKDDYPALYKVLGDIYGFGKYITNAGTEATYSSPGNGSFRLPDLRARFIVGCHEDMTDYAAPGKTGGERTHKLTVEEMPSHSHQYELYAKGNVDRVRYSNKSNVDNDTNDKFSTSSTGGNKAHENRPPYYALMYIIRAR